jgi:hypothetical protein
VDWHVVSGMLRFVVSGTEHPLRANAGVASRTRNARAINFSFIYLTLKTLRASLGHPLRLHPASVLAGLAAGAGMAGFTLRPCPLADRLGSFQWHQG